jgi:hypothetical protein
MRSLLLKWKSSQPLFKKIKCGSYEGSYENGYWKLTGEAAIDISCVWNEAVGRICDILLPN